MKGREYLRMNYQVLCPFPFLTERTTMIKVKQFVSDLPEPEDVLGLRALAANLRSRPGQWAEIDAPIGVTKTHFLNGVRRNLFPSLPAEHFDVRIVNSELYMRYIP